LKELQQEKIWDPVSRLWHWILALAIIINWTFGTFMSFDTVVWHFYTGYLILGLIAFRMLWGFIGPAPVRFSALVPTPSSLLQYLKSLRRREPSGTPGHNPLGSLWIVMILPVIAAKGVTGLFIESEDFFEYGPLYEYVSEETVKNMSEWHHTLSDVILLLVSLHVAAILYYLLWKKENLIKPMITGWKWVRRERQDV
jgi:cytochrome b